MMSKKIKETDFTVPADGAQVYIAQMLQELSLMAETSGLKELASLLRATVAASQVDLSAESEA